MFWPLGNGKGGGGFVMSGPKGNHLTFGNGANNCVAPGFGGNVTPPFNTEKRLQIWQPLDVRIRVASEDWARIRFTRVAEHVHGF